MTDIKVRDAAKIIGRDHSTVAKMIRAGDLKAHKRGKTWYMNEAYIRRVAATMLSSEDASRANLANGRLPGKVSKPKHIPESRAWAIPKPEKKETHKTDMELAIEKHLPAHTETMARVNAIRERVVLGAWAV